MTFTQIIFALLLLSTGLLRGYTLRKCAHVMDAHHTSNFLGVWLLIACVVLYPFYGNLWHEALPTLQENPILIVVGLLKGAVFWLSTSMRQTIMKHSASSASYVTFISLGFIAFGNSLLGEELNMYQWTSAVGLSLLGILYAYKGHLNEVAIKIQLIFAILVIIRAIPSMVDYTLITAANWYVLMVLAGSGMIITSFATKHKAGEDFWHFMFTNKTSIITGIVWVVGEVFFLYTITYIFTVTVAAIIIALAVPVFMVSSAIFWKEGTVKSQLAFSIIGLIIALPMFLFK